MKLNKTQRAALREKLDGRCAYCGQLLEEKWHADHIEPIGRNDWMQKLDASAAPRGLDYPHRDTLANMNPACVPCNLDKHSQSLDSWRDNIRRSLEMLERDSGLYRRAVRYGLMTLEPKPIVFYFETLQQEAAQ